MSPIFIAAFLAIALFLGVLTFIELGRQFGRRVLARDPDRKSASVGALEGAIFGLLGLLIAFTFSGAASRFDSRRQLVVEEANAIGTAYLRIDLVAPAAQAHLRESFRRYLDSRLEAYAKLPDIAAAMAALKESTALQASIWTEALAAVRMPDSQAAASILLLPALNQMFDITTTRTAAAQMHPPAIVYIMLMAVALMSALLSGYDLGPATHRSWMHMLGFAAIISVAFYVIIDLEYPRLGLLNVKAIDQVLVDLRASMR